MVQMRHMQGHPIAGAKAQEKGQKDHGIDAAGNGEDYHLAHGQHPMPVDRLLNFVEHSLCHMGICELARGGLPRRSILPCLL